MTASRHMTSYNATSALSSKQRQHEQTDGGNVSAAAEASNQQLDARQTNADRDQAPEAYLDKSGSDRGSDHSRDAYPTRLSQLPEHLW